jgi:AraC-like DNA-binding protein
MTGRSELRVSICQSSDGAEATLLTRRKWPGIETLAYDVRWGTKRGWVTWSFAKPVLCYLRAEVGGRGETREHFNVPCEGEYYGSGHVSFFAAAKRITLYSDSLREAQYWCFLLSPEQAEVLTLEQSESISQAASRIMFRNERVQSCLELLCGCDDEGDSYSSSISRALLASLLDVVTANPLTAKRQLTGTRLRRVVTYIGDHLDKILTNEDLAHIAGIPPGQFGKKFREATGISPQRWQMDARVRKAQRLMVGDPRESLADIATIAGFSDQSHFTRAFLDVMGVTPTVWLHQRR